MAWLLHLALWAWAAFPAGASPRPLVLTGPRVTDPDGFPDGGAKLAYLERAVTAPAALPAGPATAGGYPLISARAAIGVFMSTAAKGPPVTTRLRVTSVRLGTGLFPTDRGAQRLPAWLAGFGGVPGPAAVLAVAPARIFVPLAALTARPPYVNGARLGPDGRTLTVQFTGMAAGSGPCTVSYRLDLAESRAAVAVAVLEQDHGSGSQACPAVGYPRQVTTVLPAPLGGRVVVDGGTGTAVAVTGAAPAG